VRLENRIIMYSRSTLKKLNGYLYQVAIKGDYCDEKESMVVNYCAAMMQRMRCIVNKLSTLNSSLSIPIL